MLKRPNIGEKIRILRAIDGVYLYPHAIGVVIEHCDRGIYSFGAKFETRTFFVEKDNWELVDRTPKMWPPKTKKNRYEGMTYAEV
jgi:hypothetical protein